MGSIIPTLTHLSAVVFPLAPNRVSVPPRLTAFDPVMLSHLSTSAAQLCGLFVLCNSDTWNRVAGLAYSLHSR